MHYEEWAGMGAVPKHLEPETPEALGELHSDIARAKVMNLEQIQELLAPSMSNSIYETSDEDPDSPIQAINWYVKAPNQGVSPGDSYIKSQTQGVSLNAIRVKWQKIASWIPTEPPPDDYWNRVNTARTVAAFFYGGTFALHKTDVSAGVEMGGVSLKEDGELSPCPWFRLLVVITFEDGSQHSEHYEEYLSELLSLQNQKV
jgi:hypothetical protein